MTNTTEYVLPLSCSCSNCDWKLCTMKTKINKDILVCCCGEKNRSEQFVFTCNTSSAKDAAKPIKEPETRCQSKDLKKPCYEKDKKKEKKSLKKGLKKSSKDKIDNKQAGKKSQKNVKIDCVSKDCSTTIYKSNKNNTVQASSGKSKETKNKQSICGAKSEKCKRNDLYSKIEEIYKICCCELCDCPPTPPLDETSSSEENRLNLDDEIKPVCLCFQSHKEGSERNKGDIGSECPIKPVGPGTPKANPWLIIDKEAKNAAPLHSSTQSREKIMDEKQPGLDCPKPGKAGLTSTKRSKASLTSPRSSKASLSSPRPEKQTKEIKAAVPLVSPKSSCGQLNSPCYEKQEKEVKIILSSQEEENLPELSKDKEHHDDCPCHNKDVVTEVKTEEKSDAFPICGYPTPTESPNLICSCTDSDISEDGYPICACQPDDKEHEECSCSPDEMPTTSSVSTIESKVTTAESCKCDSCECINCLNARKKGEAKGKAKGGIRRKQYICKNCLISVCRKDRNICVCERRRTAPNRKIKPKTQINKYDIHRTLLYENLPFNITPSKISVCVEDGLSCVSCLLKDRHKSRLCGYYILCKNNLHEYENITSEVDRCGCSPCECQFCNKNVTDDNNISLGNYRGCRCTQCDSIISCSNLQYDNRKLDTNDTRNKKLNKKLQDMSEKIKNIKWNYDDILYENLTLLKKGEILSNFKTDKEKLVNNQLRFALNKDLLIPYVVIDEKVQVINKEGKLKHTLVAKKSIKKNSKEKIKANKSILTRNGKNENSKECLNLLIPSNSNFMKKSLIIIEPERTHLKITNEEETVRNIRIYIKLKNICDNADEYIKHLKDLLEQSKRDNENYETIVEKIKNIRNTSYAANNHGTTTSRVLELLEKETKKN